jgi:hypothetical protein
LRFQQAFDQGGELADGQDARWEHFCQWSVVSGRLGEKADPTDN